MEGQKEKKMGQAIFMLSGCILVLVMLAMFYSLWDIINGRWSEKQQRKNEMEDQEDFDNS
ncbi:hypothetical protein CIN_00530 [Commensalibacter intestini A911]|uniref:Uncharacterized protein n=2 Tax=Commensalibacter intestini TaxID=479936 RepID=G6EXF7_9PROT|nr:hypothetical protein CIN_00530 [Commensalibacter intestini A911]